MTVEDMDVAVPIHISITGQTIRTATIRLYISTIVANRVIKAVAENVYNRFGPGLKK